MDELLWQKKGKSDTKDLRTEYILAVKATYQSYSERNNEC